MFISFRKPRVIGRKIDIWLRNWKFTSQWNTQPLNHAHFRKLFSKSMITTHTNICWKYGILKQIIIILIVFG